MCSVKLTNQWARGSQDFMCGCGFGRVMQMKMHLFIKQTTKVPSARHWHKREQTNSVSSNRMYLYLSIYLGMYLYLYRSTAGRCKTAFVCSVFRLTTYWLCTLGSPFACPLPTPTPMPNPLGSVGNFIDKHLQRRRRSHCWAGQTLSLRAQSPGVGGWTGSGKLLAFCDNVYLDFALLPIADIAISIPGIYTVQPTHTHTHTHNHIHLFPCPLKCAAPAMRSVAFYLSIYLYLKQHVHM